MNFFLLQAAPPEFSVDKIDQLIEKLIDLSVTAGRHILGALLVYLIGAFLVKLINRLVHTDYLL